MTTQMPSKDKGNRKDANYMRGKPRWQRFSLEDEKTLSLPLLLPCTVPHKHQHALICVLLNQKAAYQERGGKARTRRRIGRRR